MNFKRYHVSKNLFDVENVTYEALSSDGSIRYEPAMNLSGLIRVDGDYTVSWSAVRSGAYMRVSTYDDNKNFIARIAEPNTYTSSSYSNTHTGYIRINYENTYQLSDIMLNTGSQPLPYEPYSSEVWHDTLHYIHNTSTDTITTLPAVLYPNVTTATVGLKGNTVQNGTPTPDNPIQPQECGDLETTGVHAGQYKIPISSANTTTNVYLGEVQTTRKVKKLVLTGEEIWNMYQNMYYITVSGYYRLHDVGHHLSVCSHFPIKQEDILPEMCYGLGGLIDEKAYTTWNGNIVFNPSPMISSLADWKSYLADQYAAGTPVCVWYVLAEPTTGIVNEPLRKIGTYADEVSGITIPTTAGADSFDVLTTLKPSEVTVNYKGWHPVQSVHERENGAWN